MSLKNKIEGFKSNFLPQVPDKIKESMRKAEEGLRELHLAERALGTGAVAIDFTLPNARGEPVSSEALRGAGPVVLSFYRGVMACAIRAGNSVFHPVQDVQCNLRQ